MPVQFSRGCPFNCEFCDIIIMNGRVPRTKTSRQMIGELESLVDAGWREPHLHRRRQLHRQQGEGEGVPAKS